MSDNVYRVLMGDNAPFSGLANVNYFDRLIKGKIIAVHYDLMKDSETNDKPTLCQMSYRTVDIEWLEGKPRTSNNVHIPELVSFLGYGLNCIPSIGDIVYFGFDTSGIPVITNIISRSAVYEHGSLSDGTKLPELNKYGDPVIDRAVDNAIRPTPIRFINEGEISLVSLNSNSELYFDKYGSAKLISRVPNLGPKDESDEISYSNGLQCGNRLWEISVGQDIFDENLDKREIKKSSFGNNIQFQILGHQNNCKVDFDSEGNIEINNNGNNLKINVNGNFDLVTSTGNSISLNDGIIKIADNQGNSITMNSAGIHLGDNADFSAVLGESLNTLLASMIDIFNAHTHLYLPGPGDPTSTEATTTPMKISDILSKTVKLKQ